MRDEIDGVPNRLPRARGNEVVLIGQVARALGWTTERVRGLDDLLRPIRLGDGARGYHVERAMVFIRQMDRFNAWSEARANRERRGERRKRRRG